jgi:GPH family glycoside/pentoside/hexuronide:cation symporter
VRIAAFWGLGTFATTTMLNGVSVVLLYFLVTFVQLEPILAGALLFGSKLLDVITDPPMGLLSDRTETRWGRRRPYLLGSALFCGLSFAMLFNVPVSVSGTGLYLFLAGALALYALSYTAFQVPYMAMPAELTDDYHERTRVMGWRVVFMTIGNMAGSAGVPALVKALGEDRAAYGQMGLIVGGLIAVAMLATALGTRGARRTAREAEPVPLATHLAWLRANRPLLVLMGTKVLIYAGISSFVAVMLFFLASVLRKGPEALAVYGLVQTAFTILFTPVCARVSRAIGKKRAYVICLVGFVATLATWLLATPEESLFWIGARGAVLGIFAAGNFLYGNSMLMDSFAWDYQQTGVRREGVLSAAFSFVEKSSLALGPLIIGALLSAMGFDKSLPPTAPQSASAVQAMYLGFVWIPVCCQLGAAALLRFYTLDEMDLRPRIR